ncbi:molecular chaperone [Serratia sp. UGAL515B_01]|uniref:fimbrial biogenesis chaperone n=1 Tax=Serratia sp. UGAL515B_01 TaxID=2986763 RepID=UPI002954C149|nr:molecular chaperone [Serratia sp. UGAL515B_01]WON76642.1 molecular chaperone [Serratia sp. UGAL515B_01]
MRKWLKSYLAGGLLLSSWVQAGVVIESSRVVFSGEDRERSLQLLNANPYPVVVQAWIDDGAPEGTPENAGEVPVIPLPGLFRLEPGEKKNLRLLATQVPQPQERESLYWLNIYEIPPTEQNAAIDQIKIKVAIRLQLKMLYRPKDLSPAVNHLLKLQHFNLIREPGRLKLEVENRSPYYATYQDATLTHATDRYAVDIGMLAPFSSKIIILDRSSNHQYQNISYQLINDDGDSINGNQSLVH